MIEKTQGSAAALIHKYDVLRRRVGGQNPQADVPPYKTPATEGLVRICKRHCDPAKTTAPLLMASCGLCAPGAAWRDLPERYCAWEMVQGERI
jgi:hypothetical protein